MRTELLAALLALPAVAEGRSGPPGVRPRITLDGDRATVHFDESGRTTTRDFVAAFSEPLDVDVRIHGRYDMWVDEPMGYSGERTLGQRQLWSNFQTVLRTRDFIIVPSDMDAPSPRFELRRIRRVPHDPRQLRCDSFAWTYPSVSLDELDAFRDDVDLIIEIELDVPRDEADRVGELLRRIPEPGVLEVRVDDSELMVTGTAPTLVAIREILPFLEANRRISALVVCLRPASAAALRVIRESLLADAAKGRNVRWIDLQPTGDVVLFGHDDDVERTAHRVPAIERRASARGSADD